MTVKCIVPFAYGGLARTPGEVFEVDVRDYPKVSRDVELIEVKEPRPVRKPINKQQRTATIKSK